jgi:hypothetical protein
MKKLLSSALCFLLSISAFADNSIFDAGKQDPYFGARISLDIASPGGEGWIPESLNNGAGFSVGAIYNIPLYMNLYFEPGLNFFYNTFGDKISQVEGDNIRNIDASIRNFGFRIPLAFGYHFDFEDNIKVAVFTGPQLNYGISMKEHMTYSYDGNKVTESNGWYGNGANRFDLQWIFGASVTYDRYYVGLTGGIGATNLLSDTYKPQKLHRNTFSISVGYNF